MSKLVLLSIIVAMIAIPVRAAREKNARKGLRKTLFYLALFNVVYLLGLLFIYGRV